MYVRMYVHLFLLSFTGEWQTPEQKDVAYTNWISGEPNNYASGEDCAFMRSDGKWNDMPCREQKTFVCHIQPGEKKEEHEQ